MVGENFGVMAERLFRIRNGDETNKCT